MAALTANKDTEFREPTSMDYPVAAGVKIFGGALFCVNASNQAVKATDATGLKCVGVSRDLYDNTNGSAGDMRAVAQRNGVAKFAKTGTLAVGDLCYVADDQTVTDATTAANEVVVGTVVRVDSDGVLVDLRQR